MPEYSQYLSINRIQMPALHSFNGQQGSKILLWDAREDEIFFRAALSLSPEDADMISKFHPERRKEWLAGRFLVWKLAGMPESFRCKISTYGQPVIEGDTRHISISHTHGLVAATISSEPVGLDIQPHSDKLVRVQSKFASQRELSLINGRDSIKRRLLCWCGKEAMFKLYAKGAVDFRKDMYVDLASTPPTSGTVRGQIQNSRVDARCLLLVHFFGETSVVQAMYY